MDADLSAVEVFADQLQARGDPRGELLALELAAERAPSCEEARRLNCEAQRIRDAHPALVWPEELADTLGWVRAGFVVAGFFERLFAPQIARERLLGLRKLVVRREEIEPCVRALMPLRARGLSLDRLVCLGPIDLSPLHELATIAAPGPAIRSLFLPVELRDVEAIASLAGLRECGFAAPLREAELRSLAPLRLERLHLRDTHLAPEFGTWFGATLEHLRLLGRCGSLDPLQECERLRGLQAPDGLRAAKELCLLEKLEKLTIGPDFVYPKLSMAAELPSLRELTVLGIKASHGFDLGRIRGLEALTVGGDPIDLASAAALPGLRSLDATELAGGLSFAARGVRLSLHKLVEPIELRGDIVELALFEECNLHAIPSAVLANLRRLELHFYGPVRAEVVRALPSACPNLERLVIEKRQGAWGGVDLPELLRALPRLRGVELPMERNRELAELASACPQVCPYDELWPAPHGEVGGGGGLLASRRASS